MEGSDLHNEIPLQWDRTQLDEVKTEPSVMSSLQDLNQNIKIEPDETEPVGEEENNTNVECAWNDRLLTISTVIPNVQNLVKYGKTLVKNLVEQDSLELQSRSEEDSKLQNLEERVSLIEKIIRSKRNMDEKDVIHTKNKRRSFLQASKNISQIVEESKNMIPTGTASTRKACSSTVIRRLNKRGAWDDLRKWIDVISRYKIACKYPGCDLTYERKKDAYRHYRTVHLQTEYQCDYCKYITSRKDHLRSHIARVHLKSCKYKCKYPGCKDIFKERKESIQHYRLEHLDNSYFCNFCEYVSERKGHLNRHVAQMHSKPKKVV